MQTRTRRWGGFAAWAGGGAVSGLAGIAMPSVGLLVAVLAVAVVALVRAGRHLQVWPDVAGFLPGAGSLFLLVGLANLNSTPCPSSGSGLAGPGATGAMSSCGGFDPWPWLLIGVVLAATGLAFFLAPRR
ncbi:MAG: hypothetical protein AB1673_08645 [Actinomycetota bacterium]